MINQPLNKEWIKTILVAITAKSRGGALAIAHLLHPDLPYLEPFLQHCPLPQSFLVHYQLWILRHLLINYLPYFSFEVAYVGFFLLVVRQIIVY